jgi:hypothetical protein
VTEPTEDTCQWGCPTPDAQGWHHNAVWSCPKCNALHALRQEGNWERWNTWNKLPIPVASPDEVAS